MDPQVDPGEHDQQDKQAAQQLGAGLSAIGQAAEDAARRLAVAAGERPGGGKVRGIHQRALHPDVPQVAEAFGQKRARAGDQILQQPVKAHGGVQRKEQILSQALVPAPVHRDDEQDHEGLLPQEGQRQHDLIHYPAADLRQLLDRLHDGVIKGQAAFQ